jgi:hypothetical protein
MFSERRNVAATRAQRWDFDLHYVEAVEKVFAKSALGDKLLQILIRCRQQSEVRSDGRAGTEPLELALLKGAQQFCLRVHRQVSDFIKEESTVMRLLDARSLQSSLCYSRSMLPPGIPPRRSTKLLLAGATTRSPCRDA